MLGWQTELSSNLHVDNPLRDHPTRPSSLNALASALSIATALALFPVASASDFRPGDERVRHHLQYLSENQQIDLPLSSWPIDSDSVVETLDASNNRRNDDPQLLRSLAYVQSDLVHSPRLAIESVWNSSYEALRAFSTDFRETAGARVRIQGQSGPIDGVLTIAAIHDASDGKSIRLDNTRLSVDLGNWTFGGGWVDRWWGPGWQSSLILSHNARPSPGLFVKRNTSKPFSAPILKHLGPWTFEAFANRLENDRFVPDANLLGARFQFKPIPALEIGLSRTAQWGGQGRPENLDTFFDLLIGNDNRGDSGISEDASNEPGNQLGGIDWRYTFPLLGHTLTFYGQLIGEDEAGGLPSREIGMAGLELPIVTPQIHARAFLEFSDTTMRFLDNGIPNSAYNHSIYRSGYRYYGQSIGASTDNDSRALTLGGYLELTPRNALNWRGTAATLNWDGAQAGNRLSPQRTETYAALVEYETALSDNLHLKFAGQILTEPLGSGPLVFKKGVGTSLKFRF